ncbi:MAG: hypothetical protein II407_02365, partial [Prevotella sp.]|nr:hypothetical protein [Prevotella sp.]
SIEQMFVEDANANANANLNSKLNLKLKNSSSSSSSSIKITNKKLIGSTKNISNTQQLNLKLKASIQETQGGGYLTDDAIIESIDITLPSGKKAIAFVSNNKYIGNVLYYSELPEDGSDITKTKGYEFALEYAQSQLEVCIR